MKKIGGLPLPVFLGVAALAVVLAYLYRRSHSSTNAIQTLASPGSTQPDFLAGGGAPTGAATTDTLSLSIDNLDADIANLLAVMSGNASGAITSPPPDTTGQIPTDSNVEPGILGGLTGAGSEWRSPVTLSVPGVPGGQVTVRRGSRGGTKHSGGATAPGIKKAMALWHPGFFVAAPEAFGNPTRQGIGYPGQKLVHHQKHGLGSLTSLRHATDHLRDKTHHPSVAIALTPPHPSGSGGGGGGGHKKHGKGWKRT